MKITKDLFSTLPDFLQKLFTANGDEYAYQEPKNEDVGALKRAKEREKEEKQKALDEVSKLQTELEDIRKGAIPKGDVEALEKSYKEKISKLEGEYKGQLDSANSNLHKLLIDNKAIAIAQEISTSPELILPHIKARLTVDTQDGEATTRVIGGDGKITASTLDDLKAEFIGNEKFSSVIIGSKASGGGASSSNAGGASSSKSLSEMTATEEAKFANENPEAYQTMLNQ